jgi:hypothetical protein
MSAPARRRKVKPAKKGRVTFSIVVDAHKMVVDYRPNWMSDYGQFEFRSQHKPARWLPVSETGYALKAPTFSRPPMAMDLCSAVSFAITLVSMKNTPAAIIENPSVRNSAPF